MLLLVIAVCVFVFAVLSGWHLWHWLYLLVVFLAALPLASVIFTNMHLDLTVGTVGIFAVLAAREAGFWLGRGLARALPSVA